MTKEERRNRLAEIADELEKTPVRLDTYSGLCKDKIFDKRITLHLERSKILHEIFAEEEEKRK